MGRTESLVDKRVSRRSRPDRGSVRKSFCRWLPSRLFLADGQFWSGGSDVRTDAGEYRKLTFANNSIVRHQHSIRIGVVDSTLSHTRAIQANTAYERIACARARPAGLIRLSCPGIVAQILIGPLIPHFVVRHPEVRLGIEVAMGARRNKYV